MKKQRKTHQEPTDPEQIRRQQCNDAAWLFLLAAVARRFPSDIDRENAIVALGRPRGLKTLTGSPTYAIAERFRVPIETLKLMPGTLADLLRLGGEAGPDGRCSPIAETYRLFVTWRRAKRGAERKRRDFERASEISRERWRVSREVDRHFCKIACKNDPLGGVFRIQK